MSEADLPAVEQSLSLPHVERWWPPDATSQKETLKYRHPRQQGEPSANDGTPSSFDSETESKVADRQADLEAQAGRELETAVARNKRRTYGIRGFTAPLGSPRDHRD
jgi:hypothetical protein